MNTLIKMRRQRFTNLGFEQTETDKRTIIKRDLMQQVLDLGKIETAAIALPPLLKWAGGKTWLAPRLRSLFEPYRSTHIWTEPFTGGMGATLGVMPDSALLNDTNPHLINLYEQIRSGSLNLSDICQENTEAAYYQNRAELNERSRLRAKYHLPFSPVDAALFYYLLRTCYRGLCRFNLSGGFNTPYGNYKKPKLDHPFSEYQKLFQSWDFVCGDFEKLESRINSNSFIYIDPPYDCEFTSYSEGGFSWEDQVRLAHWVARLNVRTVASNAASDRIIELYKSLDFEIEIIQAPRSIGHSDRASVPEILATKNL